MEYTITLDPNQMQLVVNALMELPAKTVLTTWEAIKRQLDAQAALAQQPPTQPPDEPHP